MEKPLNLTIYLSLSVKRNLTLLVDICFSFRINGSVGYVRSGGVENAGNNVSYCNVIGADNVKNRFPRTANCNDAGIHPILATNKNVKRVLALNTSGMTQRVVKFNKFSRCGCLVAPHPS